MRVWIAIGLSMLLCGCLAGQTGRRGIKTEPASMATVNNKRMREYQPSFERLIVARMELDTGAVGEARATTAKATVAEIKGRIAASSMTEADFDRLIISVGAAEDPKSVRNDLVSVLVASSTANCNAYVQALRSGQVTSRMTTDLLGAGFATAASLVRPAETAEMLSALSAYSITTGASIDRNIFAQQGAELVADAIMQLRMEGRRNIEANMKKAYADWPMGLALADVFAFHGDCTMMRGFSRMRDAVVNRDLEVRTLRAAASAVAVAGGSKDHVLAVFAGAPVAVPEVGDTIPAQALEADIARLDVEGRVCLAAAQKALTDSADGSVLVDKLFPTDKPLAECSRTSGWVAAFQDIARKLVSADKTKALLDAAQTLVSTAKKTLDETNANPQATAEDKTKAGQGLKEAQDKRKSEVESVFSGLNSRYALAAETRRKENFSVREAAIKALSGWAGKRPPKDVVTVLKAIGGPQYAPDLNADPFFSLAIAAASAAGDSASGKDDPGSEAARVALNTMRGFIKGPESSS